MRVVPVHDATVLVERLRHHRTIGNAPRAELQWIASTCELREYESGEVVARKEVEAADLIIVLSGRVAVTLEHGTGTRHTLESRAGTVTGVLPYSRMGRPMADAIATEATELLALPRAKVLELTRECPEVTAHLVHVMLDRARRMTSDSWQDEKTMSLGRLAAGLAHELNNPASAAARSAKQLREKLDDLGHAARAVGAAVDGHPGNDRLREWIAGIGHAPARALSPIERSDMEERLVEWLDAKGQDVTLAGVLVQCGVTADSLAAVSAWTGESTLTSVIRWIGAAASVRSLLIDVERATSRIHDLVASVRRFTYLDRSLAHEPTDVATGLADTIAVWRARAEAKSVVMHLDVAAGLPPVNGNAGMLNQAWSNLLENAIDAAPSPGQVSVSAHRAGDSVIVRIADNGPGISAEVQARMFDPFFTTKGVGQGIGLGLDIVRRVVLMHDGAVEVRSQPGRTELLVTLPAADGGA